MKVLFIGGTGFISTAVSRQAIAQGWDLFLLNRGQRAAELAGSYSLTADIHEPRRMEEALRGFQFDVVVDWIAFTPDDVERDLALFRGRVKQFVFISSASAYQKPPAHYLITESTPLHNPYWDYSRNKIACEERLLRAYREEGFPSTIVRPSLTYDPNFPIAIGGWGCYTLADRIKRGQPIIVHGDGSSLWVVTHAEDFGRGFLGLLGNHQAIGHAFHITSDEVLTWDQIYRTIGDALGVEPHMVHIPSDFIARVAPEKAGSLLGDKTWSAVFDNTKIKHFVPGFQTIIPFRQGIRRTLDWFDADEHRRRIDPAINSQMDRILSANAGLTGAGTAST
ncbi:MAG TPA: SDR family oxidoreductase [Blastocatellia bacterium]|nr:SDR family oxidoreductase [Blastocatellia bacterium]